MDWENVLQYVSEPTLDPIDFDTYPTSGISGKPVAERASHAQHPVGPMQVPTPPASNSATPPEDSSSENTIVSVSTTFYPGANIDSLPPDVVLLSTDVVFFYVHSHKLLGASNNGFNGLLPAAPSDDEDEATPIVHVPQHSTVLNVILHTIYNMACVHYAHPLPVLCTAVDALGTYGVTARTYAAPSTPLFQHLLLHAPTNPIELYIFAASHSLHDLAVMTSPHLLSFSLPTLTDEMATRMGPVYLKRLFFLHLGRSDALKRLLLPPPHPHAPTPWCDYVEQKKLTRAWALAAAYLAWDARPDLSVPTMESALSPLGDQLSCDQCRHALTERIRNLTLQWSSVKRTI
ncbi:hypothetical protein JAAARDRAFT_27906 [Jaapia argillacea MUCL 33604]|uniref:BTB domain-containing protein n=1 Tax=Jaapia argillacea MUCL 33604 TaxID=933084 RepID=A0A067QNR1_9AGAM|nr:hypothetical protein JAAARDRAFT_27906 [Jaapia argillacea MUCL 33604]